MKITPHLTISVLTFALACGSSTPATSTGGSSTTLDAGGDAFVETVDAKVLDTGTDSLDASDGGLDASDAGTSSPCFLTDAGPGTACQCNSEGAQALDCTNGVPTCCVGDVACEPTLQTVPVTCSRSPSGVGWCCSGPAW
jgi:hypothetical protein